jgi:hypothetical protein
MKAFQGRRELIEFMGKKDRRLLGVGEMFIGDGLTA